MWISELSDRTGQPVDTIKHYLRVGVLPKGTAIGPLRAEYDESHVARLMLVKALHEVGRLSLDQIRQIFDSVDDSRASLRDAVGRAHLTLSSPLAASKEPSEESMAVVEDLIDRRGWRIRADSHHRTALAVALDTLGTVRDDGYGRSAKMTDLLDLYAGHAEEVASAELRHVDVSNREATLNSIVVGTVLFEPLILVIRRLAHETVSLDWWAEKPWHEMQEGADPG